ncbi:MAG: alpha-amylase family protein [Gemmataceae bacterium]
MMPKRSFLLVAGVWFLAASSAVAQPKPAVWDERAVMPQPFDTKPYHRVRVPGWVQDTVGCGYTLSVMDSAARERAAAHGVTISEMGFVDPFYAYYDSKLLKRRSPHVPAGKLEKDIAEYKKLGVRILGVYPPTLQGEVYETHPDWRRIATNTTEIPTTDMKKFPHGGMLCPLGPYGDFFIDVLAEILTKFPDVDAFSFDGLHYGGVCYCEHCRKNFRKDTGKEIPKADLNDAEFRRYQHWADRRMENLVQRMQERLKGIKPDVALVTWSTNAGRWGHFLSLPRNMPARMNLLLDAPDQEFWMDESNRGNTIVPAFTNAYMWAITDHRVGFSEPYLMSHGNPYGNDSFPPHEIERRMMLALTWGASPSIAVAQPPRLQQELYRCMDEVQKRKPWLTHKEPERWAAILMSDNTRTFYGREAGKVEERYMSSVLGAFRACVEEHLPVNLINDWNLNAEDLAKYKVLILPNAACLDERQVKAIDAFVKNGGGLVASLETSLFDEFGEPRKEFALNHLFGGNYRGPAPAAAVKDDIDVNFAKGIGPDYWEKRKNVFDFRQDVKSFLNLGKMQTYVGPQTVTFKGPAVRVAPHADAKTAGWIRGREASSPELAAVIARRHDKGKVVYSAAGFDSANYLYSYPYHRVLLKNAIEHAAPAAPPVQVKAPMCVQSTVMRQTKNGTRLVVHLFNDVNTTGGRALPMDDVPLREEVLPIADIRVQFEPGYRIKSVKLQPEGKELPLKDNAVTVPKLEIHTMVVAELE